MPNDGDLSSRIDRILAGKARPNARAYIDEKNLQIHIKEVTQQDPTQSFSKIINDISSAQVSEARAGTAEYMHESNRLNVAMQEAQQSFEAMMELHNQIREAYQQIVEMQ